MSVFKTSVMAIAMFGALGACTTDEFGNRQASRGLKGAGIGAASGAAIGAITGRDVLTSAAIGAAVGAVAGIVTEDRNRYADRNGQRYYYGQDNREYYYDEQRRRRYGSR